MSDRHQPESAKFSDDGDGLWLNSWRYPTNANRTFLLSEWHLLPKNDLKAEAPSETADFSFALMDSNRNLANSPPGTASAALFELFGLAIGLEQLLFAVII